MQKEREAMFADTEHKGPELKAAYEEYQKAKAANAEDLGQKLNTLLSLFREITLNDVRTFMKPYQGLGAEAPNFVGVMGEVIQTQLKKTVGRLGLIKGYQYQKKLED